MKLTRCPHCETLFEVSLNELQAAEGAVRCGQCLRIFNATYHLNGQDVAHKWAIAEASMMDDAMTADMAAHMPDRTTPSFVDDVEDVSETSEPLALVSQDAQSSVTHHKGPIPTITERLNADSIDNGPLDNRDMSPENRTLDRQESAFPSSPPADALDFETLLGLTPNATSSPKASSPKDPSPRALHPHTDDLASLMQHSSTADQPASPDKVNEDDLELEDDYDELAESWSDWVRQQWQWIGAAIILILAGAIGVLSMKPGQSPGLSNYRIESTQVQAAAVDNRLNIQFEVRNLTDQPMPLSGVEIRLKNLTDSILSEHHLSLSQLQGNLDPIPPFSSRTLEAEVRRPKTLVASVEIIAEEAH